MLLSISLEGKSYSRMGISRKVFARNLDYKKYTYRSPGLQIRCMQGDIHNGFVFKRDEGLIM